uniref:DUF4806 domain-containing protein n=1 Tax=Angiostrongylus cantonensis TaxID=6313 RepID=A0A0K0DRV5_ANGCA
MPVIFLCLINGDSMRFIEYTLFIRRKLCKPVFTDSPCSFLNAFYFFSTVVYRYVNKISGAANKSSPKYVARRLRLVDKIYAFIKQHSGIFCVLNIHFLDLGLPTIIHFIVHLYVTQDCQVFSHLLVAGRCFEEDDIVPELANLEGCSVKDKYAVSVPSLVTIFPTSYLHASNDMCDLLHLARAELYRYSFILQRMEKYCFRRKLLNLIPQIYWPDFKTSVKRTFYYNSIGADASVAVKIFLNTFYLSYICSFESAKVLEYIT